MACGFVIRELFKGNPSQVDQIINDKDYMETLKELLKSQNDTQSISEGLNCLDDLLHDPIHQFNNDVRKKLIENNILDDL